MKANELMIGDWINIWNYPNENPKEEDLYPAKIVSIIKGYPDEDMNIIEGIIPKEKGYGVFSRPITDWKGIPLTSEILENNGFRLSDIGFNLPEDNHKKLELSMFVDGNGKKRFVWTHCLGNGWIIEFNYVHELQHALKLCGIEKTIGL